MRRSVVVIGFCVNGSVFIDRPRLDASAKANLAQISLPVMDGDRVVGTITVGIDTRRIK